MNTDTLRTVNQILEQGYYEDHTGLGEGGWEHLYFYIRDWGRYILRATPLEEPSEPFTHKITARTEAEAIAAFHKLYRLDKCIYEIVRVYRHEVIIEDNIHEKENQ